MRKQGNSWQFQDVEMWTFKERDEDAKAEIEKGVERNVERNAMKNVKRNAKKGVRQSVIQIRLKGNGAIPI